MVLRFFKGQAVGYAGSDTSGTEKIYFVAFFLLRVFILPQSRTYTPGTYNPNARGSDACRGSNCLWTRTLDRYTRAGLLECVVSTMLGPLPETTQDRKTKDTPSPRIKIKISDLAGNRKLSARLVPTTPEQWTIGTITKHIFHKLRSDFNLEHLIPD